jgi:single-strand DNA-binding protein
MIQAFVVGNLGADPEMRYSTNGSPWMRFNVASNGKVMERGELVDKTDWVQVVIWGERAEKLMPYLKKGMRVAVTGDLDTRPWNDQQGTPNAGLQLRMNRIEFMSSRDDNQQSGDYAQPARQAATPNRSQNRLEDNLEDLDLPF